jgi:hydrogenase-4 component F
MSLTYAVFLPAAAPLLAGVLSLILPWRLAARLGVLAALAILSGGAILASHSVVTTTGYEVGLLRADALTAWMLIVIGAVATVACWAGVGYLRQETGAEHAEAGAPRRYLVLVQLFLACMVLDVLADNLGLVWVAVEATTIVTAFLVGHRRTRASVEAAWKYVVLCSVGIAIAFLGTVCVYAASVAAGAEGITALDWTYLTANASTLDPDLIRLAAGLILLGFGTKAGLAPMHSWLPDAHSQAPAPVSALMSGVLLSVAFYAILRYRTITDAVLGPSYTRTLLLIAALASLAVAATLLIAQRDYKRLLAYSSIAHAGLIALAGAFGAKLAIADVLRPRARPVRPSPSAPPGRSPTGSPDISAVSGLAVHSRAWPRRSAWAWSLLGLPPFSCSPPGSGSLGPGLPPVMVGRRDRFPLILVRSLPSRSVHGHAVGAPAAGSDGTYLGRAHAMALGGRRHAGSVSRAVGSTGYRRGVAGRCIADHYRRRRGRPVREHHPPARRLPSRAGLPTTTPPALRRRVHPCRLPVHRRARLAHRVTCVPTRTGRVPSLAGCRFSQVQREMRDLYGIEVDNTQCPDQRFTTALAGGGAAAHDAGAAADRRRAVPFLTVERRRVVPVGLSTPGSSTESYFSWSARRSSGSGTTLVCLGNRGCSRAIRPRRGTGGADQRDTRSDTPSRLPRRGDALGIAVSDTTDGRGLLELERFAQPRRGHRPCATTSPRRRLRPAQIRDACSR